MSKSWNLLALGIGLLVLAGCADGPMYQLAKANPWIRKQWAEDEQFQPTLYSKLAEMKALESQWGEMSPDVQHQWALQLREILQNDPDPQLRAAAVRTLGAAADPFARDALNLGLKDSDSQVRIATVRAWGRRGERNPTDPAPVTALATLLGGDVDLDVRLQSANELGKLRGPQVVQALGLALNDNDPALQHRAMESLRSTTGERFGNDVMAWREYVAGGNPTPRSGPSLADRFLWFRG